MLFKKKTAALIKSKKEIISLKSNQSNANTQFY